jgi:hypothetical protein
MEITDPVCIYTDTDPTRAEIIKGFLQSEGIRCFLDGEQASGLGLTAFGIRVMVAAGEADHARKLIQTHEPHKPRSSM